MQTTRRDVLSFASVGAAGAATLALGACASTAGSSRTPLASKGGKGPAIEGPYLDLRTGKGNQLAYARIQGDLDGAQKYFWFKGYVNAVQPEKRITDLMGAQGFGAIRLVQRPDGAIERLCREIILYTDLRSGEVLQEWRNPLTSETVKPVHVDNDPFNYLIEEYFPLPPQFGGLNKEGPPPKRPAFILPWYQHGEWLEMEIHIHLAYPSALQPDKWPRESAGKIAQVSEYFAHHVRAEDMQNPKLTTVDYRGTWNRVTPWLPWMLMGQVPGYCLYNCFMGTTSNLDEIFSRPVLDYAEKNYAKYFTAPEKWSGEPSLSSLEHYARTQKPAPAR